ncbi:hypothetical protein A3735_01655 [Oleiphilus sp. HI0061]|uniref:DUF5610 domain-containing protein n=3 Tax=unclassified Oleiphilus TaxID=2631174 RepID=UPI0007D01AD2|nr:DUF5610 domain-containing protein [Oleiphilus sp. HI0061]KZY60823.1 hypothetical protein A3735_01655 [Oleiphilus sp. HI0061]
MNALDNIDKLNDGGLSRHRSLDASKIAESTGSAKLSASMQTSVETQLLEAGTDSGRRIFSRSIETNFSFNITIEKPQFEFKVPSPSDVAHTVLGFVERRIESELRNGADESRIGDLLSQARKGIEAGFSSAKEDISALGLMDEKLEEEIAQSRHLVDEGVDDIEGKHLSAADGLAEGSKQSARNEVAASTNTPVDTEAKTSQQALNVYEFFTPEKVNEQQLKPESFEAVSKYKYASHDSTEFSLTTRDGDKVSIRLSDTFASIYQSSGNSLGVAVSGDKSFEYSVEGELDESELTAINELLSQLGNVTELFFQDRFQDAFESAMSVGFDSSEIASFSLDLSKTVAEELRTYGAPSSSQEGRTNDLSNLKRYQPIVDMVNHFNQMNDSMGVFESPRDSMVSLLRETLERVKGMMSELSENSADADKSMIPVDKVTVSHFIEFSEYLLSE